MYAHNTYAKYLLPPTTYVHSVPESIQICILRLSVYQTCTVYAHKYNVHEQQSGTGRVYTTYEKNNNFDI